MYIERKIVIVRNGRVEECAKENVYDRNGFKCECSPSSLLAICFAAVASIVYARMLTANVAIYESELMDGCVALHGIGCRFLFV